MENKFKLGLTLSLLLACVSTTAAASDIQNYCEDMRAANGLSFEWRNRCVATMEVQQKYKNIEDRREQDFKSINDRTHEVIMFMELSQLLDQAQNEEKRRPIRLKLKQLCETTAQLDLIEQCKQY